MKLRLFVSTAALAAMISAPAFADNVSFIDNGGTGKTVYVSSANPLPTTGGGGSGGAVTAASGAYALGSIVDIGTGSTPGANTLNGRLAATNVLLGGTLTIDTGSSGNLINAINGPTPAGTNIIGQVGIDQTTQGSTNGFVVKTIATGGGASFHLTSSAASNNATLVSTGAHTVYDLEIIGTNTAIASVRFYDTASSPTCSSATGVIRSYPVQATTGQPGGVVVPITSQGISFTNGLAYCVTGAVADNDNTNAPTGVSINGGYK